MRGSVARGAFAVAVLVSLVVLFTPASGVPAAPPGVDKVVHGVLFAVLAVSGRWAGVRRAPLVCLLVAYGAGSEVVQGVTPLARSATVADWLADVAGVLAGSLLWELAARRRTAVR
jgi:hypothetical protein